MNQALNFDLLICTIVISLSYGLDTILEELIK